MRITKYSLIVVATCIVSSITSVGFAQTASQRAPEPASVAKAAPASTASKATKLGRIVVTAHGFPIFNSQLAAVDTAFNRHLLNQLHVTIPGAVMHMVPGVAYSNTQQKGLAFISIRGISQNRNTTTPVVTKLNGVTEISPLQFNQTMYDLSGVEVIKGPEGSLYGPNGVAGAILIRTVAPSNHFTGDVRTFAGNFGQQGVSFGVGGPIVKNRLLFRAAGIYTNETGYFNNVTLGGYGENPQKNMGGRLWLRWLPNSNLRVDFVGSYQRTLGITNNFHYQPAILTSRGKLAPGPDPFDFSKVNASHASYTFYNNNPGLDDYRLYQSHIKVAYNMPFATLSSITGFTWLTELTEADQFPYTGSLSRKTILGNVDGTQGQFFNARGWNQEIRLTSSTGEVPHLHWLVGAYYSYVNRFISSTTGVDKGLGILPKYEAPLFGSKINQTLTYLADDNHNFTRSLLGSIKYDLPKGFSIGIADRYDRVSKNQFVSKLNTAGKPGAVNRATFYRNSPRATIQWIPNKHLNFYATWGEAFRAGGFNQNGVGKEAALIGLNGVKDRIDAEITRTTELGFKSTWLNDRLIANVDVYHINDQNQPFFVFVGGVGAQILININEAEMYGGEFTLKGRVFDNPAAGNLLVYASGSLNNNYIKQYSLTPSDKGNRMPQAPQRVGHLGFTYQHHLFDFAGTVGPVSLFTRWDLRHKSREAWDAANSTFSKAINTLNVRIGVMGQSWSLILSDLNATHQVYNEEFVKGGYSYPALPQRWTLTFRKEF